MQLNIFDQLEIHRAVTDLYEWPNLDNQLLKRDYYSYDGIHVCIRRVLLIGEPVQWFFYITFPNGEIKSRERSLASNDPKEVARKIIDFIQEELKNETNN